MSVNTYFGNNLLNTKPLAALKVLIQVCVCVYCILNVFQSHETKLYSTKDFIALSRCEGLGSVFMKMTSKECNNNTFF